MSLDQLVPQWERLHQGKWYIELFQEARSWHQDYHPFGIRNPPAWEKIYGRLNENFGCKLSDEHRGSQEVYLQLKELSDGAGELLCYGEAHRDSADRRNAHYFVIEGSHSVLQRSLTEFEHNPLHLREFVRVVFNWENLLPGQRSGMGHNQFDPCAEMKVLYILDAGKGYSFIRRWQQRAGKKNPEVKVVRVS